MSKVLFEKKGHVAYVTINRPERLNACDFETYNMLADIWTEFRDDPRLASRYHDRNRGAGV